MDYYWKRLFTSAIVCYAGFLRASLGKKILDRKPYCFSGGSGAGLVLVQRLHCHAGGKSQSAH